MPRLPCVSFVGGSSFTWHRSGTPGDRSLLRRPPPADPAPKGAVTTAAKRTQLAGPTPERVLEAVPAHSALGSARSRAGARAPARRPHAWPRSACSIPVGPRPPGPPRRRRSRRSPRSLSGPGTRCLISKSRPRCSRKRPLRAQEQRHGGRAACGRSSTPPGPAVWTWAKGATTPCLGFPVWRRHTATAPPRGRCGVPWPVKVRGPGVPWPSAVRGLSVNTGSDAAEPRPSASASQNPSVRPHCQMPTNNSETRPHEGLK